MRLFSQPVRILEEIELPLLISPTSGDVSPSDWQLAGRQMSNVMAEGWESKGCGPDAQGSFMNGDPEQPAAVPA